MLGGSGVSVQWEGEGDPEAVRGRAGDCLVHLPLEHAHTLQAGPGGLDVLAFGERARRRLTRLPRAGVAWLGPTWAPAARRRTTRGRGKWPPGRPRSPSSRRGPRAIVDVDDVEAVGARRRDDRRRVRDLGAPPARSGPGSRTVTVAPGKLRAPPHCHSAEEEIFVVLEGTGTLVLLWEEGSASTEHPVRTGLGRRRRPAGTRVAHAFRAGDDGLTVLVYGTRDPTTSATTRARTRSTSRSRADRAGRAARLLGRRRLSSEGYRGRA